MQYSSKLNDFFSSLGILFVWLICTVFYLQIAKVNKLCMLCVWIKIFQKYVLERKNLKLIQKKQTLL